MDSELRKQYQIIGKINAAVMKANNLTEAIHAGMHIIIKECGADFAVAWYSEPDGNRVIHPNYWVAPVDFYSRKYESGSGIIGRVFESGKSVRMLDYASAPDTRIDEDWAGVCIGSMICVPMSHAGTCFGVLQIVRTNDHDKFTEDEADICEILSLMTAMAIIDANFFSSEWHHGKEIIRISDLKKEYINGSVITKVLKGINLNVYEGEFLVLLGESGCGKSTLLNIIGGLDSADGGSISFMDTDMTNATEDELTEFRRSNVGFIFQSYNLMPNLNAKQNLSLIAELVENPMPTDDALKLVGLEDRADNYPSQLSGGQQQRISIARALIKRPRLILADEPTAALDCATSIEVLSVIENIIKDGTTLVMVTHNEEITKMADRVVRIRNGRVFDISVNRWRVPATSLAW